jgi:hypothetical protein
VYDYTKLHLQNLFGENGNEAAVLVSSVVAGVPASLVGVPADVLKKRMIVGDAVSMRDALSKVWRQSGVNGLFVGWQANLVKDVPFAGIKMSLYEGLKKIYCTIRNKYSHNSTHHESSDNTLTAVESSMIGLASGIATAIVTCPLDCVNTRIKSGELESLSVSAAHFEIYRRDGVSALFRGLAPRCVILGLGSTIFWYSYAEMKLLLAIG